MSEKTARPGGGDAERATVSTKEGDGAVVSISLPRGKSVAGKFS
jgi:hypothetical protein